MVKRNLATHRFVPLLLAVSLTACSGQAGLPTSPSSVVPEDLNARSSEALPGIYQLTFRAWVNGRLQEVSSLRVRTSELILQGYVADSAGRAATAGSVTFEYCSYEGGPPNDIARADEAPMEACDQGIATWARLSSISVTAGRCPALGTGYACLNFGVVSIPRQVGFRMRYQPQGSGIPAGTTVPRNFTWY